MNPSDVLSIAVVYLADFFVSFIDPDTAALLRERATTDQSGAVRQAAAHRWRPAGATTPTLPLLREQRRRNT